MHFSNVFCFNSKTSAQKARMRLNGVQFFPGMTKSFQPMILNHPCADQPVTERVWDGAVEKTVRGTGI